MVAFAAHSAAAYSPVLLVLQAIVVDSFVLVMEARLGVPAKTAFDVATLPTSAASQ